MSLLGLAAYGSDESDNDEEVQVPVKKEEPKEASNEISDEEDIPNAGNSALSLLDDEDVEDIPGLSSSKSFFASLPSSRIVEPQVVKESFIDENEDLESIPKAKVYSETPDLKAIKPKKKGPVRIMAPSLMILDPEDDEKPKRPLVQGPAKIKSGLSSLLPPPKSATVNWSNPGQSTSASKPPSAGLVPRSLTRKPIPTPASVKSRLSKNHDSDDESDVPFFTMDSKSQAMASTSRPSSSSMTVKSNPEAANPKKYHPSHQFRLDIIILFFDKCSLVSNFWREQSILVNRCSRKCRKFSQLFFEFIHFFISN